MIVKALTDKGSYRDLNEDSFFLPADGENFCAVADGMGGHNGGEVASREAVKAFAESMRGAGEVNGVTLRHALEAANLHVYETAREDFSLYGMGTTFTALGTRGRTAVIAHVGDSRAYLLRAFTLRQLTKDHSLVQEMVDRGLITQREARFHPRRNVITRALGIAGNISVDVFEFSVRAGDCILLCTDGLTGDLEDEDLLEILTSGASDEACLKTMIEEAMRKGSTDNITAMLVRFEETGE